jgi:EAL domain-containing protein (putative c-di-GMP-specific phosphodiesterase class I)
MPADILKLDRLFVAGIASDPQACKLTRGILDLARAMGKLVIAEGIEDEAQVSWLRDLGCTLGQGFHLRPAVEADEVLQLLRQAAAAGAVPGRPA